MAVAAGDQHSGRREALLRNHDMFDAVTAVAEAAKGDVMCGPSADLYLGFHMGGGEIADRAGDLVGDLLGHAVGRIDGVAADIRRPPD